MRIALMMTMLAIGAHAVEEISLQKMLDEAVRTQADRLVLPDGRLRIAGRVSLNKAKGLTIEGGRHTTLVFSDHNGTGWSFNSCRDIVLRGFAIDYDPIPFIQARITGRSDDGKEYEFEVAKGFPGLKEEDQKYYRQAYIFEPDQPRWKPWIPDIYARKVEILSPRHGRFVMGYVPTWHELITLGDRIVLTIRSGGAIRMNDCEHVRVEDVTFYAAPGAAYLGRYMRGDNYYRYTIEPGPKLPGASEARLMSTCADGLNIAFATKGPTIEGGKFSFMGDDSVNLHGVTFAVLEQESPVSLLVAWPYTSEYLTTTIPTGALARRLGQADYAILGTAPITGFTPLPDKTPAQDAAIRKVWPRGKPGRGTVFRLTLAEPLPAEPGEYLDIPANNAPGFAIRDCVFQDHRARGLRIMASHGIIENNTFRRLKMNAISIGAEYSFWREAGWADDVVIRNNIIEDVCRDAAVFRRKCHVLGAISVFGPRDESRKELTFWPGNSNISIIGNTITGCPKVGIHTAAARNVQVFRNRLENVAYTPAGLNMENLDPGTGQPIDTRFAHEVVEEGNEVGTDRK